MDLQVLLNALSKLDNYFDEDAWNLCGRSRNEIEGLSSAVLESNYFTLSCAYINLINEISKVRDYVYFISINE